MGIPMNAFMDGFFWILGALSALVAIGVTAASVGMGTVWNLTRQRRI